MDIIPFDSSMGEFVSSYTEEHSKPFNKEDTLNITISAMLMSSRPDFMLLTDELPFLSNTKTILNRVEAYFEDPYSYDKKEAIISAMINNLFINIKVKL